MTKAVFRLAHSLNLVTYYSVLQQQDTITEKALTQQQLLNDARLREAQTEALVMQQHAMIDEQVIMEQQHLVCILRYYESPSSIFFHTISSHLYMTINFTSTCITSSNVLL